MEKRDYNVSTETAPRNIMFPYPVSRIGLSKNNPPVKNLHTVFPDKVEICLRLSGEFTEGVPQQTIAGETYNPVAYPHVVVKPPLTEYSLINFGTRKVFYMIYSSSLVPELEKLGLFKPPHCWEIRLTCELEGMLERINNMVEASCTPGMADRIDIQCFQILHELLLMKNEICTVVDKEREMMLRIDSYLRRHAFEELDFSTVARKFELSRSSFFRYWKRYSELSPSQYLLELRLQEACRKLAETRDRITDIARELHLGEPAYMGMVFRKQYGQTPLEYRKTHSLRFR